MGMLMFQANNSRTDISYAVQQYSRFTNWPKASPGADSKRIIRYFQGTKDKGLIILPRNKLQVDCHVDADFSGLWNVEDEQDPTCVNSCNGYFILFMDCPLMWTSKLQTQIYISTMEAEYIALSTSMRELVGVRELLKELYSIVLKSSKLHTEYCTMSKNFGKFPNPFSWR